MSFNYSKLKCDLSHVQVHQQVGYCPQFDALLEKMTGRETLRMFARLRGVPEDLIASISQELAQHLLLEPHMDKLVGAYRWVLKGGGVGLERTYEILFVLFFFMQFISIHESYEAYSLITKNVNSKYTLNPWMSLGICNSIKTKQRKFNNSVPHILLSV